MWSGRVHVLQSRRTNISDAHRLQTLDASTYSSMTRVVSLWVNDTRLNSQFHMMAKNVAVHWRNSFVRPSADPVNVRRKHFDVICSHRLRAAFSNEGELSHRRSWPASQTATQSQQGRGRLCVCVWMPLFTSSCSLRNNPGNECFQSAVMISFTALGWSCDGPWWREGWMSQC